MKSFRTVIGITVLAATESYATHEFEDFDHTVEGPDGNKIEVKGIKADEHTQNFNKLGDSFDVVAKNTMPEDTFKCDDEDDLLQDGLFDEK
jgi:hypothetical protein